MKIKLSHKFEDIVSIDNLLNSWKEFLKGKRNKRDVQEFQFHLMDNILSLHYDLINHSYKHGGYQCFRIHDPKERIIHKASVRDRLLHHAVYRILYPFFDRTFISDSFSCRKNKGTHKALNRFREFSYIVSRNNTKPCYILKCDIKKFFASMDQNILVNILDSRLRGNDTINLLKEIIFSFKKGLPLGNLTSQLFANVYLNEFDQFARHELRVKYYIRYADDFVIFSQDNKYLKDLISQISNFIEVNLGLILHPDKIYIKSIYSGLDFLGWKHFSDYRILRRAARRRMFLKLESYFDKQSLSSYLGLLKHGNCGKIKEKLIKNYFSEKF